MTIPPNFNSSNKEFVTVLKERVELYFKLNKISKKANRLMIFKTVFHSSLWLGCYFSILFGNYPNSINYILWAILGLSVALTAVNIGHDAIHGAYSKKKWINKLLSFSYDLNGASSYMWESMHNLAHHTYTNISGYDGDLDLLPIIRLSSKQKLRYINRYQYLYTFFFYCFATLFWVFTKDYIKFFKNEVGNYSNKKHKYSDVAKLFINKLMYYILFIVVPIIFVYQHDIITYLWSFLLMHFVAGLTLSLIFALAHLVEKTNFPEPTSTGTIQNSWVVHQLYTTANFASNSRLAGFITGGLNTQVEHHLFPHICSIHYRKIAPIVKETAREFNIPYLEYPTFFQALKSHIAFLRKMGGNK